MSLGTVQKALNRLAIEGWVIRKRGHGSFVADPERSITEVYDMITKTVSRFSKASDAV
ncbi:MAG: GntR family transcriptional regulator [Verrucomicrobia bacterium]|nr:GntR family transcriptional regulator [Verrucomicrobiota bacterium]